MKTERLLKHYERIADAPDAVARLRRFILDLAVRGKLAPQDSKEEPASELLNRIGVKKTWLVKVGKIKGKPSLAAVADEDKPFQVPRAWCWVRFANIVDFSAGRTPSRNDPSFWNNGDHAWVSIADMDDGQVLTSTKETISDKARERVFGSEPALPGTIIMSFKLTIGKIARLGIPAFHNEAIISIKPHLADLDAYLFKVLPQFARQGATKGAIKGATLNRDSIANILFPLPPLAEQYRIVTKIDELMALCDRLEAARAERETRRDRLAAASLARLNTPNPDPATFAGHARFVADALPALTTRPDQIEQLRQTILNLAVRSKLVPQDPKDDPASKLLIRIAAERAWPAKGRSGPNFAKIIPMDEKAAPFAIAPSWVWTQFGDIVISRDGERVPVSKEERNSRAKKFDYYGASGVIDKIDSYLFDKPLLLIGEDGANLVNRSTPIAFIASGKYWVNNHAHVIDGLSEDFLRYLALFINAIDLKPYVTGTAQPKMNQAKMNSIPVALPPLAEQRRIVAKVDELIALCDRLEATLTTGDDTRRRLLDALLAEALAPGRDAAAAQTPRVAAHG